MKTENTFLGKINVAVNASGFSTKSLAIPKKNLANGKLFCSLFLDDIAYGEYIINNPGFMTITVGGSPANVSVYSIDRLEINDFLMHWGQFVWSGDGTTTPINPDDLHTPSYTVGQANDMSGSEVNFEQGSEDMNNLQTTLEGGELNPINQQFFSLTPIRGEQTVDSRSYITSQPPGNNSKNFDRWAFYGTYIGVYRDSKDAPGKLGEAEDRPDPHPATALTNYSAYGISQISKSFSRAQTIGSTPFMTSTTLNTTSSNFKSENLTQFMDINGDSYPDILDLRPGTHAVQLTDILGGYTAKNTSIDLGSFYSTTFSEGAVATGSYINEDKRYVKQSLPVNGSVNFGSNTTEVQWVDLNGDGLPDKYDNSGSTPTVQLNTGGTLLSAKQVSGAPSIPVSTDISWNLGGSIPLLSTMDNFDQGGGYSIGMGVGINHVSTKSASILIDLNGDGLPDQLNLSSGNVWSVKVNTGTSFTNHSVTK